MVDSSSQHHTRSTHGPEDPVYSFTFSQRQALVQEIGEYVVSQLMTTDFVHRIGEYAADRVMSRIGDMLSRYTEPMSEERCTSDVLGGHDINDDKHVASDPGSVEPLQNIIEKGDAINNERQMEDDHLERGPTSVEPLENIIGKSDDANDRRHISDDHLEHGPTSMDEFGGFHLVSQWTQPTETSQLDDTPVDADVVKQDGNHTIPPKLDFTKVRRRVPSAALRSPFRQMDKRGENYDRFMRLKKPSKRNIGIGYGVTKEWFRDTNERVQLDISMIDAYHSILYCKPEQVGLRKVDPKTTITSTTFMSVVSQTWKKYHPSEKTTENDPKVEGEIESEDLFELAKFVNGELPNWGVSRPWFECDKVLMVANISSHWVTCTINFLERYILIYDSLQHTFEDDDLEQRRVFFTPLCVLLPLVLHYSDFYSARTDMVADMSPWSIKFPEEGNLYMQNDNNNCGVYALKYAEAILTGKFEDSFEKKELKAFRKTMARNLFEFSTDESTIDTITTCL
ncbi:uncharacterized protein LOC131008175 [Salvia miltiorrhiza]|uniref:uncharacterized protein LOC131008175 n=1 Tax=Salvia miltiorrhiza TaxID=226208 RepID=UPI0025AC7B5C|nr:uncharacterized protein LOC131008175 [Salvia miltiorrhiza]